MNDNVVRVAKTKNPPSDLLLLFTLALGFVMAMVDVTAVNVALPNISLNLAVPLSGLVWVVDGYTLTFAALLLAGAAIADRFGAKIAYQAGLTVFILSSVLCAIAHNGPALIAARLLQGAGAALFMPSSLSLLSRSYENEQTRAKMLSIWSAMVGASASIGPLIGGLLIHAYGWRSVFWINVPVGVLGILLAQTLIPASARQQRALSLLSHILGFVILASLTFFLIEGPARGWGAEEVLLAAGIALVSVAALVRRERRGAHPLVPPALFQAPGFVAINLTGFFINFGAFGQLFLLGLYLQQGQSTDALHAGLLLLPMMASITAGNLLSGPISVRVGTRKPMLLGLGIAALTGLMVASSTQNIPYVVLMLDASIMNLAAGTAIPAMTATVMKIAGREHANSAAAALNANRQIGALVGVAVIGTILHQIPGWDARLLAAFCAIALAYAIAFVLVFLHVGKVSQFSTKPHSHG